MLGIIGAMKEEVDELLELMDVEDEKMVLNYHFYQGKLGKKETVLVQGGVGKVNATISTTLLLTNYDIDHVINIGSAGGVRQEEEVGDIVISERVVHSDVDLLGFDYPYGQIPGQPLFFEADPELVKISDMILKKENRRAYKGLIASGDQFICREDQVNKILKEFPDTMCCEMEAGAVAQTCSVFGKPFIITRGLSDIFKKGHNAVQFDQYLKDAAVTSARMCYDIAQEL